MKKRFIFSKVLDILDKRKIITIIGSRQVGKTTILKQLEKQLKENGELVYYFTLEDMDILKDFNESPRNLLNLIEISKEPVILIDEIQYLDNPSNFLKYIYDLYHESIRIIVTGSSAFYIDKKFEDSLAGRKRILKMYPLHFREFLYFKDRKNLGDSILSSGLTRTTKRELENLFNEFTIFGGYPEVVVSEDIEEKKSILREISTSYLKRDILESGIRREDKFYALVKILAGQTGGLLNKNELSRLTGVSTTAVDNYIHALQKSLHITLIRPFYTNVTKEIVKMPKLYFNDIGLRNQFLKNFRHLKERQDRGNIIENIFLFYLQDSGIDEIKYWRSKTGLEIDFILNNDAFEVKSNCRESIKKQVSSFHRVHPDIPVKKICMNNYKEESQYLIKRLLYEYKPGV